MRYMRAAVATNVQYKKYFSTSSIECHKLASQASNFVHLSLEWNTMIPIFSVYPWWKNTNWVSCVCEVIFSIVQGRANLLVPDSYAGQIHSFLAHI